MIAKTIRPVPSLEKRPGLIDKVVSLDKPAGGGQGKRGSRHATGYEVKPAGARGIGELLRGG